jgi:hypothetical protein
MLSILGSLGFIVLATCYHLVSPNFKPRQATRTTRPPAFIRH